MSTSRIWDLLGRAFREHPLGVLVVAGVAIRLSVFLLVSVNDDTGMYMYDAILVHGGQLPVLDFLSRSPLFHVALAGALSFDGSKILAARAFMLLVSVLLGVAVFLLTSRLHSRLAGLAATAIFLLTPFSVVWGLWVKTEQAAQVVVIAGLLVTLSRSDSEARLHPAFLVSGLVFGTGFLVRRVVIAPLAGFVLYLYVREFWGGDRSLSTPTVRSTLLGGGFLLGVFGWYALLAWPAPDRGFTVAIEQLLSLFGDDNLDIAVIRDLFAHAQVREGMSIGGVVFLLSTALGLLSLDALVMSFCVSCLGRTVSTLLSVVAVSLPALLFLLVYLESYLESKGSGVGLVTAGVVLFLGAGGALFYAQDSPLIPLSMAAIVGVAIVFLDRVPTPRFSALRSPPVILPVLLLFMLAVGYLVRDRLIFTTYFQDFYPYVCVLGGIAASSLLERLAESDRVRLGLVGLFVVLLACGFSLFVATPLAPVAEDGDYERLSTVRGVMGVGDDIEARTTPRQEILTGQPLYVVDSDRELALDLSRRVYYVTDNESGPTKRREMIARIESVLKNREVPYVVVDGGTSHGLSTVLERSPRVVSALEAGYCPADDASLYDRYNATLYVRSSSAPAC